MKFLDKLILFLFSTLILIFSVLSIFTIVGWIDSTTVFVIVTNALSNTKVCNVLIGINVVLILGAIKGIFFESSTDEEKSVGNGIMLENDDGKLLVTKETITSIVNSVVAGFEGVKDQQSKITLDENNDLSILLTIAVSDQAVIKDLSNNIQVRVKDAIKKSLDVEVKSLDIKVKDMVTPVKDTKEA